MARIRHSMIRALGRLMGRHEDAGPVGLQLRAWMMRYFPSQLSCIEFENFVYDYREGSLSERERETFDLHMELCSMCRVHFATYLRTIELGRRICVADNDGAEELPDDLVSAIMAARNSR